jgi:hypothetical protein
MSTRFAEYSNHFILNVVRDIQVLKTYGAAPYATALKKLEQQIKEKQASVNEKIGVKVLHEKWVSKLALTLHRNQILD